MAGAAWATVLGQAASCVMGLAYLKRFRSIRLTAADFGICWDEWRRIAALGLSNSFNQLAMTVVQIVLNNSLKYYGVLSIYGSEIPLATSGIVIKINAILTSVIVGISQGAQPIISFNYGAGQYARVRGTYSLAIRISLAVSAVGFAAFQIFPRQIVSLFGTGDQLYFEFGDRFMRCYLLMVMINCVQLLSSNFFCRHWEAGAEDFAFSDTTGILSGAAAADPAPLFGDGRHPVCGPGGGLHRLCDLSGSHSERAPKP